MVRKHSSLVADEEGVLTVWTEDQSSHSIALCQSPTQSKALTLQFCEGSETGKLPTKSLRLAEAGSCCLRKETSHGGAAGVDGEAAASQQQIWLREFRKVATSSNRRSV